MSKYNLALVEYYHPNIHGSENVKLYSHFFYSLNITPDEFFEDYPDGWVNERQEILNLAYNYNITHPIIENYKNILRKTGCLSLDIIQPVIINDNGYDTYVCILKTFWLRCFQRKWKKYYKNKILIWKNPKVLYNRQIHRNII